MCIVDAVHNSSKLEAAQVSISRRIDKQVSTQWNMTQL